MVKLIHPKTMIKLKYNDAIYTSKKWHFVDPKSRYKTVCGILLFPSKNYHPFGWIARNVEDVPKSQLCRSCWKYKYE